MQAVRRQNPKKRVPRSFEESPKRPYQPPVVRSLGPLRTRTQGAHVGGLLDIGGYSAY